MKKFILIEQMVEPQWEVGLVVFLEHKRLILSFKRKWH